MVQSYVNIKHSHRSHLYWGIDKTSGEVVEINSITARGLSCNCKCAACDGNFIARKGERNKHHFAHESNYECVYANEIAIYLLVKKFLDKERKIFVPSVKLKIGKREEVAKNAFTATVTNTHYQCNPKQYPPLLLAVFDNRPTRILLDFHHYFTPDDFRLIQSECKSKDWDCISISLPHLSKPLYNNLDNIQARILTSPEGKSWLQTALKNRWISRLDDVAQIPKKITTFDGATRFDCPIHRRGNDRNYYAIISDCEYCEYNLSIIPDCKCLAYSGIKHLKDFKRATEELQQEISIEKQKNEERLKLNAEINRISSAEKQRNEVYSKLIAEANRITSARPNQQLSQRTQPTPVAPKYSAEE